MEELLSKISIFKALNFILIAFGCLIAPFWFLFQFYDELYNRTDISKFIVLSLSIGVPMCLLHTFLTNLALDRDETKDENLRVEFRMLQMGLSSGISGFFLYFPCCLKYFNPYMKERDAIEIILFTYGGAITLIIFKLIKKGWVRRQQRRKVSKKK